MVTPDIITPVSGSSPKTDSGGDWATGVYQYNSNDGDKEIYSLSFPQSNGSYTNMGINSAIYVDTTSNTWYDYTLTSDPNVVTDTGTQIKLYDSSNNLIVTLPKPTTASWISSTSNEGLNTGSIIKIWTVVCRFRLMHHLIQVKLIQFHLRIATKLVLFLAALALGITIIHMLNIVPLVMVLGDCMIKMEFYLPL